MFLIVLAGFFFPVMAQNQWVQKADLAGAVRFGAVGFSIGTKGYIGTGSNGVADRVDFWEWDQASNVWTQKANFIGLPRKFAVGFSIGTKGYIGTGSESNKRTSDFFEWDQATNTWSQKTSLTNAQGRLSAVGFSIGSKGYIGTGTNGPQRNNTFWEWDQASNAWTQKANFGGVAREKAIGFSIGTKGYLGTGFDGTTYLKDFWEFDQAGNAWIRKADLPGPVRADAVGFALSGRGYVGTGTNTTGNLQDFYEYLPDPINSWLVKADYLGGPISSAVGFGIGTKGFIGTGNNDGAFRGDCYEYTPGITPVSITTGNVSANMCIGQTIKVPFTYTGSFNTGNVFIVELSTSSGIWSSPPIGSMFATTGDTIEVVIPSDGVYVNPGTGYRIRVSSTNPAQQGAAAPQIITISAPPVVTLAEFNEVCNDASILTLSGGEPAGGFFSGNGIINEQEFDPAVAGVGGHMIAYTYTNVNGCSVSDTKELRVNLCTSVSDMVNILDFFKIFPNPYHHQVTLSYSIDKRSYVNLDIKNHIGQTVSILNNEYQNAGNYEYLFSASDLGLPVGLYYVSLKVDDRIYTHKVVEF